MKKLIFLITLLLFISCSIDEYNYSNVEAANSIFEPYLESFKNEAKKRGHDFSDYNVNFYMADINEEGIGGFGSYRENKIIIDRENWNASGPIYKEWLIFHELGHSILNRTHTSKKTESGECLSYMRGTDNGTECYQNLYSSLWREYYLDELFDKNTALPDWYTSNNKYKLNYQNKKHLIQELDNAKGFYDLEINSDTIPKYVLEVKFKDWRSISEISPFQYPRINFNGLTFASQFNPNLVLIRNGHTERFYRQNNYIFNEDIKLTIRKDHNIYYLFIDENFLHATEINNLEYQFLSINFSSEIKMDIELFKFD